MSSRTATGAQTPPERFTLMDISPVVECGKFPSIGVVGEIIPCGVTAFREGHDILSVDIEFLDPHGNPCGPFRMTSSVNPDRYEALFQPDIEGEWSFTITAWGDPWQTWLHRAEIKIPAGIDPELELIEGAHLLHSIAAGSHITATDLEVLTTAISTMTNEALPPSVRLAAGTDQAIRDIAQTHPVRMMPTSSGPWPLLVERKRALVGTWYEFFPRSEGATVNPPKSGTFATAALRLPDIAAMGFDVVYLPPIHPIGTLNRKGRNNTLTPDPHDPGSPWAIGSKDGGHDSIHSDLGTVPDFVHFVAAAHKEGIEVALDLALQAAPDHPWVDAHPEWFITRADGSIAYAENPPKKYQDIYPLNFDKDPEGLFSEVERIVRYWISLGVKIFRVDNPHTKPVWVWNRLIHSINATDPDVIFLAEAFTREPMMRALAEQGFQQSYTYFTWKTSKQDLEDYFTQLSGPMAAYMRPNVFTNTPDILHEYLQTGMPAAFAIRATLAATLSPTYGIYSGFELFEHISLRPGSEEYLNSEKFEYRPRDWELAQRQGRTLAPYLTRLNEIRRENPALETLRSLRFHSTDSPNIIAYSKRNQSNVVLIVCTLDPHNEHSTMVHWDLPAIGIECDKDFFVHDEISNSSWRWGPHTFVRLNPYDSVAHIARITSAVIPLNVYSRTTVPGTLRK